MYAIDVRNITEKKNKVVAGLNFFLLSRIVLANFLLSVLPHFIKLIRLSWTKSLLLFCALHFISCLLQQKRTKFEVSNKTNVCLYLLGQEKTIKIKIFRKNPINVRNKMREIEKINKNNKLKLDFQGIFLSSTFLQFPY